VGRRTALKTDLAWNAAWVSSKFSIALFDDGMWQEIVKQALQ